MVGVGVWVRVKVGVGGRPLRAEAGWQKCLRVRAFASRRPSVRVKVMFNFRVRVGVRSIRVRVRGGVRSRVCICAWV